MGTHRQCERATHQCCSIPITSTTPNVLLALGLRPPDRSLSDHGPQQGDQVTGHWATPRRPARPGVASASAAAGHGRDDEQHQPDQGVSPMTSACRETPC
jgi:hypothetical protein